MKRGDRRNLRNLAAVAVLAALAGCSSMERQVGAAVYQYCEQTTDADQAAVRERLDEETEPHEARIHCARGE